MNTETAPKVCSITGKRLTAQVAPQFALDKLPSLLDQSADPAPKACAISGNRLPDATSTPALPALEAAFWDQRYAGKEFVWTANANQFLVEEVAGMTPSTAIDMAAGEGRNALWLASQDWFVHAIDFSSVAMEKAQRLAVERSLANKVSFETADLRAFEPPAQTFDLVAFVYLQIPLNELAPILKRAVRAVAHNGTLLFIAHNIDNLAKGFGGPQHPKMLYTVRQIVDALGDELVIEKTVQAERRIKTADGEKVAIDMVVRAKRA